MIWDLRELKTSKSIVLKGVSFWLRMNMHAAVPQDFFLTITPLRQQVNFNKDKYLEKFPASH